jgi:single-stranded-DNA-specific exonuclease
MAEVDLVRHFISLAVKKKHGIILYGDYDCDGVISMALMRDLLEASGVRRSQIHSVIPHRIRHGYDLDVKLLQKEIEKLDNEGEEVGLVIAVDCGTNKHENYRAIVNNGQRLLVIDHHQPDAGASRFSDPKCVVINPKLWLQAAHPAVPKAAVMTVELCAAGLVYLLAMALAGSNPKWNRDRALLLAGLATCADVVPLKTINRRLLKASLKLANTPSKLKLVPGLYYLARRPTPNSLNPLPEDVYYRIYEDTYGFDWGPTLNAPGRMSTAHLALRLLEAEDKPTARKLVAECRALNQWRQATTRTVLESAMVLAGKKKSRNVMLVRHPEWQPGVVGIVASRIKDEFYRPVFVCTRHPDGDWMGSGRTIKPLVADHSPMPANQKKKDPPYDIGARLLAARQKKWITNGGGHQMAGGLKFSEKKKIRLQSWLNKNCGLSAEDLSPILIAPAPASILPPTRWGKLFTGLAPFGQDNPIPPLLVRCAKLLGIRPRARVHGELKRFDFDHDYRLEGVIDKESESSRHLPPLPDLWSYEGEFLDRETDRIFFAHWLDLEMAEYVWEISEYFHFLEFFPRQDFRWQNLFELELQLRAFTPTMALSNVGPGKEPDIAYNFQIRQCQPMKITPTSIQPR